MNENIDQIKTIRKRLGITQQELAQQSGVSQSLITKIESGALDPSYSNAQKIFTALQQLSKQKEPTAKDILTKKLYTVPPTKKIHDVITEMRKHSISQIPVVKQGTCVGLISERILLDAIQKPAQTVQEIMGDAPPIVGKETPLSILTNLLRIYPIVVVAEKGTMLGVVTKADLLKIL